MILCKWYFQSAHSPHVVRVFFFRRPATPESAETYSLPRGGGLGRGHSPNFGDLPQHPNRPNTSLAACCPLSNSLPRGERTGGLLGLKVLRGNRLCRLLFIFQTAYINGCKPKLPFKSPKSPNPLQPAPSPVGEGWGEGILRISATFPKSLSLLKYKPCGLLPSL